MCHLGSSLVNRVAGRCVRLIGAPVGCVGMLWPSIACLGGTRRAVVLFVSAGLHLVAGRDVAAVFPVELLGDGTHAPGCDVARMGVQVQLDVVLLS